MRLVGKGGIEAISRLMGSLLVCMGVQFIINGVLEIISDLAPHRPRCAEKLSGAIPAGFFVRRNQECRG